jgi:RNA-directed DNA polymerase
VIEHCRHLTQEWLQDIGWELSEPKTRIAHTLETVEGEAGFNFLGFQVREYRASTYSTSRGRGFKTLLKPSHAAVQRHWARLSKLITQNKAATPATLSGVLNPIIAGWPNSYSAVGSTTTCHRLDRQLDGKLRRWAFFRHRSPRRAML